MSFVRCCGPTARLAAASRYVRPFGPIQQNFTRLRIGRIVRIVRIVRSMYCIYLQYDIVGVLIMFLSYVDLA